MLVTMSNDLDETRGGYGEYEGELLVEEDDGQICLEFIDRPIPRPKMFRLNAYETDDILRRTRVDASEPTIAAPSGPMAPIFDFQRLLAVLRESGAADCVAGWDQAREAHAAILKDRFGYPPASAPKDAKGDLPVETATMSAADEAVSEAGGVQAGTGKHHDDVSYPDYATSQIQPVPSSMSSDSCDTSDRAEDDPLEFRLVPQFQSASHPVRRTPDRLPTILLETDTVADNEAQRLKRLIALYEDKRLNLRPLLIADAAKIAKVEALRDTLSGAFKPLINAVLGAAHLSMRTGTAFRMAPVLTVGPPGCGKTHAMEALAEALQMPITRISAPNMTDSGMWLGHPVTWKSPKTGQLTTAVIEHGASICLIDEIDKSYQYDSSDSPLNPLLSLLERSSQTKVHDEFLELEFDFSQTFFVASANSLSGLTAPLLDRFLVIEISAPDRAQSIFVARRMMAERLAALGGAFRMPADAVIDRLATAQTRQMSRLIDLGLGVMAAAGRDQMVLTDIDEVEALLGTGKVEIEMGFPRRMP